MKSLSVIIRTERKKRKLSYSQVGKIVSRDKNNVFRMENGLYKHPSFEVVMKLCKAWDIDPWSIKL